MAKEIIRNKMVDKLKKLTPREKLRMDRLVFENITNYPEIFNSNTFAIFWPSPIEPNIIPLIDFLLHLGKTVALPRPIDGEYSNSDMRIITKVGFEREQSQKVHRVYPTEAAEVLPKEKIDVVFMPCLAFSADGYRLGSGYGLYNKYLEGFKGMKTVIAYEHQKATFAHEPTDVPVDAIITEARSYTNADFNKFITSIGQSTDLVTSTSELPHESEDYNIDITNENEVE